MIPLPSAGVQPRGHPIRAADNGSGYLDASQASAQPEMNPGVLPMPVAQPQLRQPAVIDLTTGAGEAYEREPPTKRQRLDIHTGVSSGTVSPVPGVGGGELRSASGGPPTPRPLSTVWRGKPAWSFQALISETPGAGDVHGENAAALAQSGKPASPPPLPTPPWKHAPPELSKDNRSRESSPMKEVETTPYRIETPSIAPIIKGEKAADFSPWTGNHPEDVLNEQTAKQGYYDCMQVSQNESNTARPSLYAQLKHRSGLQMLSSVFAAALEKRQNHNSVSTPSTFKPPPRVTLTDNKREAWLRDLANPSVPLRRLSRTIPHGIRGKVLLDQCLSKWVPVARAVWLAKCVGANEIRAFKRKGTSGALAIGLEAKWVRDWTGSVQQFLETVLGTCGTADWKVKMTYAVSLTARLFHEHLLDHDHYIGWFLSCLEAAPPKIMPVWLLMLGIYWNNIMRYRKRGCRLAELLLEKLHQVNKPEQAEILKPLVDRLNLYVKKLVHEHTSSVILPTSWATHKDLISSSLNLENKVDRAIFQNLAERNARVQRSMHSQRTAHNSVQRQQHVIHLLDSIHTAHDISSVSVACLDTFEDRATLIYKLLDWTATPFRHGLCRVYIGVRLLRKWKMAGVDVDSHVLAFLNESHKANQNMDNVYHAISELVRSQTFSVGRYLQWLMAKGVTVDSAFDQRNVSRPPNSSHSICSQRQNLQGGVGLLVQLPVSHLPEHVRNLRDTLLARVGLPASEEATTIAAVKCSIGKRLPKVFGTDESDAAFGLRYQSLTWAVKSEIGQWLRRGVAKHCRDPTREFPGVAIAADAKVSALTPSEFYHVRDILESFGDISMLADVVKQASTSEENTVLASAVDTVNYHFDSFSIIGATADLFRRLVDAYYILKRLGTADLDLIYSLIELGLQLPNESNTLAILRQDLSRIENKSAQAAPSPLSDHIPDSSGDTDISFLEKLDQFLSSGSGMDEPTMDIIFDALVKVLEFGGGQAKLSANEACRYLAHLRLFNPKHFDARLVRWTSGVLESPTRPELSKFLPPLIGVGCVTIQAFLLMVKKLLQSKSGTPTVPRVEELQMDLLELLISPVSGQSRYYDLVTYRFHLAQQEFRTKHVEESLDIIRGAAASIGLQNVESSLDSRRSHLERCLVNLLCELLTQDPSNAAQQSIQKLTDQHSAFLVALQKALDRLLGVDSPNDKSTNNLSEAEKVINMTGDFSLPFCQLKLQMLFNAASGEEVKNGVVDVMFNAAVSDARANRSNWVGLVALMNQDAVQQIRERAEKGFLSVPVLENLADDDPSAAASYSSAIETARVYLTIIEELSYSVPDAGVPSIAPVLVEKMDLLLHRLVIMQTNFANFAENRNGASGDQTSKVRLNFERGLAFWFSVLLRMVVIHRSSFNTSSSLAPRPNVLQEQSRILISIFCISLARFPDNVLRLFPTADYFPHPVQKPEEYRPCPGILLQTHALDVAASLIDTFPDEARHHCARFLKEKCPSFAQFQNDSRFLYLLGPMPDCAPFNSSQQPSSLPSPVTSGSTPTPSGTFPGGSSSSQQPSAASPGLSTGLAEGSNSISSRLRLQHRGRIVGAYPLRPWELLEDAAPLAGVNDTAVSLRYFDARRIRA